MMAHPQESLLTMAQLLELRRQWREQGRCMVLTNGVFDLLHYGHAEYLRQACELGDILVVGVNSDSSVRALKGQARPIVPEGDRARLVLALKPVDYVTIFRELTAERLVDQLQPDIYVKGADYTIDPDDTGRKQLEEDRVVAKHGGRVVLIPLVPARSTTSLIDTVLRR